MRDHGLPGFVIAIVAGVFVYLICSFALGTFEEEDYVLLKSARTALPGRSKALVDWLLVFIAQFKTAGTGNGKKECP